MTTREFEALSAELHRGPLRGYLSLLLLIVGLATVLGKALSIRWLTRAGMATTASPAPNPFVNKNSRYGIKNDLSVEYDDPEKGRVVVLIDQQVRRRLEVPHAVTAALFLSLKRTTMKPEALRATLIYAFCNDGLVARAARLPPRLRSFTFVQGGRQTGRYFEHPGSLTYRAAENLANFLALGHHGAHATRHRSAAASSPAP